MLRVATGRLGALAARQSVRVMPVAATRRPYSTSSEKISSLTEDISKLTLLETADLVAALKAKLNLGDMPIMAPMGAAPSAAAGAAAPAAEAKPAEAEKTEYKVKLESFDDKNKVKVIREVKNVIPSLNLVTAKKFVEEAPKVLKEGVSKDEAKKLKELFESLGCKITLE